jgi:hypothetical protein
MFFRLFSSSPVSLNKKIQTFPFESCVLRRSVYKQTKDKQNKRKILEKPCSNLFFKDASVYPRLCFLAKFEVGSSTFLQVSQHSVNGCLPSIYVNISSLCVTSVERHCQSNTACKWGMGVRSQIQHFPPFLTSPIWPKLRDRDDIPSLLEG